VGQYSYRARIASGRIMRPNCAVSMPPRLSKVVKKNCA
jgi:hypothetical protein